MTSQEWEKYHNEEDRKLQKKIRKLSGKSTRRLYAGAIMILVASSHIGSTINQAGVALEGVPDEASKKVLLDYFGGGFFLILFLMVAATPPAAAASSSSVSSPSAHFSAISSMLLLYRKQHSGKRICCDRRGVSGENT